MSRFDAFWEFKNSLNGLTREQAEIEAAKYDRHEYHVFVEEITFDTGEYGYTDDLGYIHNREMRTGVFKVVTRKRDHENERKATEAGRAISEMMTAYYSTHDHSDLFRRES